ncbi:hypothetical protein TorRG33x02_346130 [Trema orientale]|uniref:Uncharacterized protein n=1 Tax=Trema orientale TaxID=63057 RepID=A0A2P5AN35_TREOI|nr:hypothetical protein TorRG33x02_346130 [Trema orientale]
MSVLSSAGVFLSVMFPLDLDSTILSCDRLDALIPNSQFTLLSQLCQTEWCCISSCLGFICFSGCNYNYVVVDNPSRGVAFTLVNDLSLVFVDIVFELEF